jgi:hypothetical protein
MELIPSTEAIVAVLSEGGMETARVNVNPAADDPAALAARWLISQAKAPAPPKHNL